MLETCATVACANHLVGHGRADLGRITPFDTRGRLDRLSGTAGSLERLDVGAAWAALAGVSQVPLTLQSMVFEPRRLTTHLALGEGPATRSAPTPVRLAEWF